MVEYNCNKCDKIFKNKNDYIRHTKRKKPCVNNTISSNNISNYLTCPQCNKLFSRKDSLNRHINAFCQYNKDTILNNISNESGENDETYIDSLNVKYNNDVNLEYHKKLSTLKSHDSNNNTHSSQKAQINTKKELQCNNCSKIFSRKDSLDRHLNKYCKYKEEKENREDILQQLLKEMTQLQEKINKLENNNINNIINNNINNTQNNNNTQHNTNINGSINIVAFGKEKLEEIISDDICKKILFKGFEAVPKLVEYIHFNEKKPEYHNCYIPNLRDKYAIVYDGNNWQVKDSIDVIETLRDNKRIYLERKFEDFYDSLDEQTKIKFKRFLNEADTDVVINRYKESLKKLLYNKKEMVINRRKLKENEIKNIKLLK